MQAPPVLDDEFEAIRPYRDDEVPAVIDRLFADPKFQHAVVGFLAPPALRRLPWLARRIVLTQLRRRTRGLASVRDVQLFLADHFERLVRNTIHELSVTGVDRLPGGRPYLFISNHRDIVMDSGLLNFVLHSHGHDTTRMAVGDNLLSERYAADLMRLNKSFMVERGVSGAKVVMRALSRTSSYIRCSLEEGQSVWIAQREGRAKDGIDRTDPALLKMLALAHRKEIGGLGDFLERVALVPVAVSYELDPCDLRKARELRLRATTGDYAKPADEDLHAIVDGLIGYKARVHLHVGEPVRGDFEDADALARTLDLAIVGGLRIFPTNTRAAILSGMTEVPTAPPWTPGLQARFESRLAACPLEDRPYFLAGYANPLRNRLELGLDPSALPGEPSAVALSPPELQGR